MNERVTGCTPKTLFDEAVEDSKAPLEQALKELREFSTTGLVRWDALESGKPRHSVRMVFAVDPVVREQTRRRMAAEDFGRAFAGLANVISGVGKAFSESILAVAEGCSNIAESIADARQDEYALVR